MASRPLRNAKTDKRLAYNEKMNIPLGLEGGESKVNPKTKVRTDLRTIAGTDGSIYRTVDRSKPNAMGGDDFVSYSQRRIGSYARNYFKRNSK